MSKRAINPTGLPVPATFSRAVEVAGGGRTVYLAGTAPIGPDGTVSSAHIEAQAEACFAKAQSILEEAGGSMDDLVFLNIYVTDMSRFDEIAPVRRKYLKGPALPAISAFEVRALVGSDWLVEIDGVAYIE